MTTKTSIPRGHLDSDVIMHKVYWEDKIINWNNTLLAKPPVTPQKHSVNRTSNPTTTSSCANH